jgi:hypothetical protein
MTESEKEKPVRKLERKPLFETVQAPTKSRSKNTPSEEDPK